jgi:hypothetical protein
VPEDGGAWHFCEDHIALGVRNCLFWRDEVCLICVQMECFGLRSRIRQESEFDMVSPGTQLSIRRNNLGEVGFGQSIEGMNAGFRPVADAEHGPSPGLSRRVLAERFGKKKGKGLTPKEDPRILGFRYRTFISGKPTNDRSEL